MSRIPFITIEEAKKKTCPYDNHPDSDGRCVADECMKWEAHPKPDGYGQADKTKTHGRCGL